MTITFMDQNEIRNMIDERHTAEAVGKGPDRNTVTLTMNHVSILVRPVMEIKFPNNTALDTNRLHGS